MITVSCKSNCPINNVSNANTEHFCVASNKYQQNLINNGKPKFSICNASYWPLIKKSYKL